MDIDQYIQKVQKEYANSAEKRDSKLITKINSLKEIQEEDKQPTLDEESEEGETTPGVKVAMDEKSVVMSERNRRLSTNFDENSNDVSTIPENKLQIHLKPVVSSFAPPAALLPNKAQESNLKSNLSSLIDKLKNQMILNASKQVKIA